MQQQDDSGDEFSDVDEELEASDVDDEAPSSDDDDAGEYAWLHLETGRENRAFLPLARVAPGADGLHELAEHRAAASSLNVNLALDKAHEGKTLKEIVELPPSALQGVAEAGQVADLRQGQQFVQIDDEYRKREAELEEELQKQYVL